MDLSVRMLSAIVPLINSWSNFSASVKSPVSESGTHLMSLFQTHQVDKLSEVAPFAMWLSETAQRGQTIAVALRDRQRKMAFATRDDAWVLDFKSPAGAIGAGIIRSQLIDNNQLRFATRNLALDLRDITKFLADLLGMSLPDVWAALAPACVADLTRAAVCVNQAVTPRNKFKSAEHDAYEIALLEPQYATGIADYYLKVGVPMSKLVAETSLFKRKDDPMTWWVSYEQLWLRVLAFYTGDPTLGWAFHEGHDPIERIATLFKIPNETAETLLLYQACGREIPVFQKRFPERILPSDLTSWEDRMRRTLPALDSSISAMSRGYWESRTTETRFHRKLRPGHALGESVAFRIFGTVEDIVAIAAVTFWNNRSTSDILLTQIEGGPAENLIRVGGVGPKGEATTWDWIQTLKTIAPLANPLGQLNLKPTVTKA